MNFKQPYDTRISQKYSIAATAMFRVREEDVRRESKSWKRSVFLFIQNATNQILMNYY
jgi:hypothetical protein